MNKKQIEFARILTKHDKKNLSQKFTKTAEELGELSRAILPLEDASGTLHRFGDKQKVLEECVDLILCARSIGYALEFTDQEFEDMISNKLKKWHGLQEREQCIEGKPIPFEIHITVKCADSLITNFQYVCTELLNVKPIVLDLQIGDTRSMQDVMTSSTHFGSNTTAYDEMIRIVNGLKENGFTIIRQKIETVPWHPAAPQSESGNIPNNCYFESHIGILCDENDRQQLTEIGKLYSARLSTNAFKKHKDGTVTIMMTLRSYKPGRNEFEQKVTSLVEMLHHKNFETEKVITEFAIYDSNIHHDHTWILQ